MPSSLKRVLVRTTEQTSIRGYVDPQTLTAGSDLEIMSAEGQVVRVPLGTVKAVYFVSTFDVEDEPLAHKTFAARPRSGGLWIRVRFRDGEVLEGVTPNNLLEFEKSGLTLAPPDANLYARHVFIPRSAVSSAQVLGVIGARRVRRAPRVDERNQIGLFPDETGRRS
jgi:hypothetical protein